jgi:hypothetical protein
MEIHGLVPAMFFLKHALSIYKFCPYPRPQKSLHKFQKIYNV